MIKKLIGIIILIIVVFCFILIIKDTSNLCNIEENKVVSENWILVENIDVSTVTENIIGRLSIPALDDEFYMNMSIKDGTDLQILATAIGHFIDTPYVNGNVCLAAHNSGVKNDKYVGYFDSIKNLKNGDLIYYDTLENTYTYKVIENKIILETDLSVLNNTIENKLTLITCVEGLQNKAYRQCIIAERI